MKRRPDTDGLSLSWAEYVDLLVDGFAHDGLEAATPDRWRDDLATYGQRRPARAELIA